MKKRIISLLLAIIIASVTFMGAAGSKEAHACGNTCANGHCWDSGVTAPGLRGKLLGTKIYTCKRCGKKVTCTSAEFNAKYLGNTSNFKKTGKTSLTSIIKSKGALSIRWRKGKDVTGYQIQYSLYSDFRSFKNVNVNNCRKTTTKIAGLKSNQMYYIRIRSYKVVDGKVTYSDWSKTTAVRTRAFGFASYNNKN